MTTATRTEKEQSKPEPPVRTVLLVDDWDECRITTKFFLSSYGYAVDCARSAEEGLLLFDPKIHDAIVTDNGMPGMSGLEMAHIIKMRSPSTPVVMYSGSPPEKSPCLDVVIQRPAYLMLVKLALDRLISGPLKPEDL